ncbi:ribonuclease domain-containing protein [Nocardiopsis composta]
MLNGVHANFPAHLAHRRFRRTHRSALRRRRDRPGPRRRRQHLPHRPALPGARHARPDRGRGPFPYPQDGSTFHNREGLLPPQDTGYYKEYTVETPGSPDRGARRIVTGDSHQEDYYTADHYASFDLVDYGC